MGRSSTSLMTWTCGSGVPRWSLPIAGWTYIWTNLKHEDVRVIPLTLTASQQHQALEYSV